MVYHSVSDSIVFVDPRDDTFFATTVWSWANPVWTRVDGLTPFPSTRRHQSLAFDSEGDQLLLFGGHHIDAVLGDTWAFKDGAWTDMPTADAPSARRFHDMVCDKARKEVLAVR